MKPATDAIIITCEHGGNRVPRDLIAAFRPIRGLLDTHRGWDPGALQLARQMARRLDAPLFSSTVSRLVVDLNRSERHPRVFSPITAALSTARRNALFDALYRPFRADVAASIRQLSKSHRRVVHISVHSFTPILAGIRRKTDLGLLYDPARPFERDLAAAWRRAIHSLDPTLRVRMNYPYRGTSDGHTTSLRGWFQPDSYAGIELEVNQAIVRSGGRRWVHARSVLIRSLAIATARESHSQA